MVAMFNSISQNANHEPDKTFFGSQTKLTNYFIANSFNIENKIAKLLIGSKNQDKVDKVKYSTSKCNAYYVEQTSGTDIKKLQNSSSSGFTMLWEYTRMTSTNSSVFRIDQMIQAEH